MDGSRCTTVYIKYIIKKVTIKIGKVSMKAYHLIIIGLTPGVLLAAILIYYFVGV